MANCELGECKGDPKYTTPIVVPGLPNSGDGGGHEFVTELPETGGAGIEYVLMDDLSDCETYRGTFVWNEDCGGWIQTSGSGGGAVERYTFEQTATGWRAKRNNTVIFTYVDKDTIDSYENTADGFQITRNGVVIFTHTDGGGGDCKEYTITSTADGWVFKEDGVTKFTYTEPANDPSDGTYFTSGTLTTAITGTTTVAASSVTGLTLADVVIGETLIYDEAGTVGRVTAVNGTNLTVETITTAPGERRGTRLGAVDDYTDLPATCAAAAALGWQTPLAGDFAYVREDTSHDSHLTEWVISSIDSSCNITWAYSHTLNAGNYVLDIYKYGDYPSGSPIPKNPDGSVTLPKDEDTKYDFENLMDGSDIIGWRVKDHNTGTVLYTYTDLNDNDTYTFEDVTVSGSVVGWRVKDKDGNVIYTYTDLNDKSDGTYFTSATLDTDITDQTTIAASTVTGLTLADVVVGETLIYDGDGTVGVVTAVSGTNLTVDTITVAGSGDASSYVYKTTGTLNTTVDNTVNLALSTLSNSAGTTPTASDIIIGKTLAWDADGTVALAVAISGTDVTFKTITASGGGGSITYLVDPNGDKLNSISGTISGSVPKGSSLNTQMTLTKSSGTYTVSGNKVVVPGETRIQIAANASFVATTVGATSSANSLFQVYDYKNNVVIGGFRNAYHTNGYGYTGGDTYQYDVPANGAEIGIKAIANYDSAGSLDGVYSHFTIHEIGRLVDPIKYLDNSEGLQDTPVGNIISYMGNNVPRHYLACDGTIYNIGDYPALEAHFVEEFGRVNYFGGNGTTTWAVPDLQGEFLRGTGTNSHTNQGNGANVGVHQDATEMPYMQGSSGNLGARAKDSNSTHEVLSEYKNVDSQLGAPGNLKYASGFTNNVSNVTPDFTARPTNTSVKYCIKYESTMQVILGADQYAVRGTYARSTALSTWQLNTLTATDGDTSLVKNGVFYAPEDGYYQLTANTGWTSGYQLWMTWQRRADAMGSTNTQAETNKYMLLNNTGTPGAGTDAGISREVLSGAVWLNKGDPVTLQTYAGKTLPDANGKYEWSIVRLTGSVDINEINLIAADDVYSTDEQLVGSYLGKPLYKKTYPLSSTTDNMDGVNVSSLGIENMVEVKAYCDIVASGQAYQLGIDHNTGTIGGNYVGFYKTGNALYGVCTNTATTKKWREVTIWYTKTSDTAGSAPNKNSLLLTRPDLWTPGTEYDFGGGLYGKRLKGTAAFAADSTGRVTWNTTVCASVATTAKVINKGGMVDMSKTSGTNWYDINGSWNNGSNTFAQSVAAYFLATNTSNNLKFYGVVNNGAGNYQYDIWFTYTKS